jgi:hypothetical protein
MGAVCPPLDCFYEPQRRRDAELMNHEGTKEAKGRGEEGKRGRRKEGKKERGEEGKNWNWFNNKYLCKMGMLPLEINLTFTSSRCLA